MLGAGRRDTEPLGSTQLSPLVAACCRLLLLPVALSNNVRGHDSKFKSPPSHPQSNCADDVTATPAADWLPELQEIQYSGCADAYLLV